jgi:hypothetical protein
LRAAAKPRAACDFLDRHVAPVAARLEPDDLPRKIAQQVATWDPGGQRNALFGGGVIDAAFDLEVVAVEIGKANAVSNQGLSSAARLRDPRIVADLPIANRAARFYRGARRCPQGVKGNAVEAAAVPATVNG